MDPQIKVGKVIEKYVALRQEKEGIERETKTKVAVIRENMNKLESWLLAAMDAEGLQQFKSEAGTAYKTTVDHAGVADWEELIEFVKANEAWTLLEKRVSKQAVKGYLDMGHEPPPGVNYVTKIVVNIRKPSE